MDEARYRELQTKMAALKNLFASRHYSQCAKFGELLLSEMHDQTHPLHLAQLNFYTALSHDTLAREASHAHRWRALSLAEAHYSTALLALSSPALCSPTSPQSSMSDFPSPRHRRGSSVSSFQSSASSATSLCSEDSATSPRYPEQHGVATPRPMTPQQFYATANTAAFARMLDAHLADVRAQKRSAGAPTVRFQAVPASPTSPTSPRASMKAASREVDLESAREAVRERRRNVRFRPRFDPTGVQKLCCEALAELGG
ncbi:hypothetical protein C7974DRAFT_151259 [Boeremia exigua]|uniref:uncharacterized protein n=1 Tax=Boeremia exigua TaxID=749465 RepID=UPI001E8E0572|nr:uncharacterized protein C7974DRAFT_151259 [Boeremia exigua]KAH6637953.1 hypothetical protein C7974DRAFT_151259 [Boeremia exigua]